MTQLFFFLLSDDPMDPINVYTEYRRHRPYSTLTDDSRFYLAVNHKYSGEVWFKDQPLGKNSILTIYKRMCTEAGLEGQFSNHSARRTGIDIALAKDVHETKVQQLYGHKNIQSLNSYRVTSVEQQKEMSNLFSTFVSRRRDEVRPPVTCAATRPTPITTVLPATATSPIPATSTNRFIDPNIGGLHVGLSADKPLEPSLPDTYYLDAATAEELFN